MHNFLIISFFAAILAGCSPASNAPWQQEAVTAHLQQTLPVPDSYQPLRWGTPVTFRLGAVATAGLPFAQQTLRGVAAQLAQDSADYALAARTAAQSGTAAADVAFTKGRYLTGMRFRDTTRAHLRQLIAAQRDTAVAFYRLAHTYRFQNQQGQAEVDSVVFTVGPRGYVLPFATHRISPPRPVAPPDSLLPPPPPPPPTLGPNAIRYY